jgi:hypothetical protein
MAAWHLLEWNKGNEPPSASEAKTLLSSLASKGRLHFWGESALPHLLLIALFLERTGFRGLAENLLIDVLTVAASRNAESSDRPFPTRDETPDEAFAGQLKRWRNPPKRKSLKTAKSSITEASGPAIGRRLRRQALASLWPVIAKVDLAWFVPKVPDDQLLWHCTEGEEQNRKFARPQSWPALREAANSIDLPTLPGMVREDARIALTFALAYPHRVGKELAKAIDEWFG